MRKLLSILITIVTISTISALDETVNSISGELRGGLRYIDVNKETMNNLTVYRGDYLVFSFEENSKKSFKIDELDINEMLPKDDNDSPYIKLKKSGIYSYSLGEIKGIINVLEYSGVNYQELTATQSLELINNIKPFILDVRTDREYKSGHLENSTLIPVQILNDNLDEIIKYKNEPIFVYCQSGNRSTVASKILIDAGFTNVYNLRGGIGDWRRRGFSIIK